LLIAREAGKAGGEGVGDEEGHAQAMLNM
jgi:hypothetical protein